LAAFSTASTAEPPLLRISHPVSIAFLPVSFVWLVIIIGFSPLPLNVIPFNEGRISAPALIPIVWSKNLRREIDFFILNSIIGFI